MDLVLASAAAEGADLALANDPDADRLAVAVPTPMGWRMLTGNEVGVLLGDHLLRTTSGDRFVANSVVSSPMLGVIAASIPPDAHAGHGGPSSRSSFVTASVRATAKFSASLDELSSGGCKHHRRRGRLAEQQAGRHRSVRGLRDGCRRRGVALGRWMEAIGGEVPVGPIVEFAAQKRTEWNDPSTGSQSGPTLCRCHCS